MHSVSVEDLSLFQIKESATRTHTQNIYVAEVYPVLMHCWGVYAILTLC